MARYFAFHHAIRIQNWSRKGVQAVLPALRTGRTERSRQARDLEQIFILFAHYKGVANSISLEHATGFCAKTAQITLWDSLKGMHYACGLGAKPAICKRKGFS